MVNPSSTRWHLLIPAQFPVGVEQRQYVVSEEDIQVIGARFEGPAGVFQVKLRDAGEDIFGDVGVQGHVHRNLVDPPQVHGGFELGAAIEPIAHEYDHL